jgi:hypothetical protein
MARLTFAKRRSDNPENLTRRFIRAEFIRRRNHLRAHGYLQVSNEEIIDWLKSDLFADLENLAGRNPTGKPSLSR